MTKISFRKNIIGVTISRIVSLLSSIAVGFLLPKVLSIQGYGYSKIYSLYAVYTALLHFGFVDGILLKIAGKEYLELDFEEMRCYTRFFFIFEAVIAAVMLLCSGIFLSGEYLFIVFILAIDMLFVNVTTYYQFVSQATQRFTEYSKKSIIGAAVRLVFVCTLFVTYLADGVHISYRVYLVGIAVIDFLMMLWYICIYRNITFGRSYKLRLLKNKIADIFKTGIILTVAYQTSHLVFALDRQFVSVLFSTEEYAVYSFAYNIVSMISTTISSISVVLLPMLKKAGRNYTVDHYKNNLSIVSFLLGISLLAYFPSQIFIEWFLPEYTESVQYIAIVLPSILLSSGISIVMFTVDKVIGTISSFFKNSVIVLAIGFITNLVAYRIFGTRFSISCASLLTMVLWYLIEGNHLKRSIGVTFGKEFIYVILLGSGFLSIVFLIKSLWISAVLYIVFFLTATTLLYGKAFVSSIKYTRLL